MPLPDTAPWRTDRRLPSEALAEVRILEPEERKLDRGSISEALLALGYTASFAGVAGLVDSKVPGSELVSDMTETFAGVYLAQAARDSGMALLHAVTGSSAARLMLPHLDERGRAVLLRFVWQAAAGIYAVFGRDIFRRRDAGEIPSPPLVGREDLIDRAVATGDEHAIKLAEACLRENAILPRPVFLGAALDGTTRFARG